MGTPAPGGHRTRGRRICISQRIAGWTQRVTGSGRTTGERDGDVRRTLAHHRAIRIVQRRCGRGDRHNRGYAGPHRADLYIVRGSWNRMDLRSSLESFMAEDVGNGDITTESVVDRCPARGQVVVKASGVVAGVEEASEVFRLVGAVPVALVDDGEAVSPGDVILEVRGDSWSLLRAERLALNILSRMSGIATATRRLVDLARAVNPEVRVAATRKTTPGFRYFEKRAVVAGGGDPHRWSLDDAVL
ncbi:MAG TPA: hypothetical protein EYP43_02425, partial [Thermoplasmata archaeon]|nr:hypothetical protein [Thermoplasmata archaeon]